MKYGFINVLKPIFNKQDEYFLKIVIKRRASTGICSLKVLSTLLRLFHLHVPLHNLYLNFISIVKLRNMLVSIYI